MIIKYESLRILYNFKISNNHLNQTRNEHVLVFRGVSFPDIMKLLTVGHVESIGRKYRYHIFECITKMSDFDRNRKHCMAFDINNVFHFETTLS